MKNTTTADQSTVKSVSLSIKKVSSRTNNPTSPESYLKLSDVRIIPIDDISPNRFQPRRIFDHDSLIRLADSIRRFGILQPITVRTSAENDSKCRKPYEIICGERRYRAAIIAGLVSVPCCVLNTTDMNSAELSIIENLIRDDLNMFEQAESFNLLITTFGLTQEEVANRVSLSQSAVANKIRLLKFEQKERELILSSGLTERHARALLRLSDPTTRHRFIEIIIKDKLNVASTESLIDNYLDYLSKHPENEAKNSKEKHNNRKYAAGIVKDLRVLTNTVEKAADTLRKSGIFVETASSETETYYNITITIPKSQERFHVKH